GAFRIEQENDALAGGRLDGPRREGGCELGEETREVAAGAGAVVGLEAGMEEVALRRSPARPGDQRAGDLVEEDLGIPHGRVVAARAQVEDQGGDLIDVRGGRFELLEDRPD